MDNPNKLLFLDIDGVLNSMAFYSSEVYKYDRKEHGVNAKQYDLKKLDILKMIHEKTDCTIVMSSSWRAFYFSPSTDSRAGIGCMALKDDLMERGIAILHSTGHEYNEDLYRLYNSDIRWVKDEDNTYHSEYVEPEDRKPAPKVENFYARGLQIKTFLDKWEKEHGECKFVILDDDVEDLFLFNEHFFRTKWYANTEEEGGLTVEIAEKCIEMLNN